MECGASTHRVPEVDAPTTDGAAEKGTGVEIGDDSARVAMAGRIEQHQLVITGEIVGERAPASTGLREPVEQHHAWSRSPLL